MPIFENVFEMTQERYLAFCNAPQGKTACKQLQRWKSAGTVLIVLFVLALLIEIYLQNWLLAAYCALLLTVAVYNRVWRRDRRNAKLYRQILKGMTTENWIRQTCFYENQVVEQDGNMQTSFGYTDFCRLEEDMSYFYLWRNEDYLLRLPKEAFTVGDPNAFAQFVQQKLAAASKAEE